ncbi:hypothetical protein COV82_00180 [Candidatus Peregrinibacteria bacterium CG11_big_fil_rev_8_21_14_0_20_46_8]|nr:MAG: hypothetical protein COV82_00180 [Candidatus Peregrinibacteria bacterium CG11_big_fil_rev_8_21_14_0_20_46_8]
MSARYNDGRVWLDKKEVLDIEKNGGEEKNIPVQYASSREQHARPDFYQDLYKEAKSALNDYQSQLQEANFKIGQLESQLKFHAQTIEKEHMPTGSGRPFASEEVARIDGTKEIYTLELLRKEIRDREHDLELLKNTLAKEKTSRTIFAVLTYILLVLQPVFWYLLR